MRPDDTNDPDFDERQGDRVYHRPSPPDSGTATSFASRHNEFPPGAGHDAAAHDRTGAPVHGDGTPIEEPPVQWRADEEEIES